jgi:hypothetical protein
MESNLPNSASEFIYDTHFYFNILSLAAIISSRWLHCNKQGKCYSNVSCSPLILSGAHFLSLEINQLHDLSLFKNMTKKQPCSEINAFKNSDPGCLIHNFSAFSKPNIYNRTARTIIWINNEGDSKKSENLRDIYPSTLCMAWSSLMRQLL